MKHVVRKNTCQSLFSAIVSIASILLPSYI